MSFKLHDESNVLLAETTAFMRAEKYLRYYKIYDKGIAIFIDRQSAIMSLTDAYNTSNLV